MKKADMVSESARAGIGIAPMQVHAALLMDVDSIRGAQQSEIFVVK